MIQRVLLPLLLALCIARMWVMPLDSSFWVDEAETAFVVHHGVNHPSLAIIAPALAVDLLLAAARVGSHLRILRSRRASSFATGPGDRAVLYRAPGRPADSSAGRLVCGVRVPHTPGLQLRSRRCEALRAGNLRGRGEPVAPDPLARFRKMARRLSVPRGRRVALASASGLLAVLFRVRDLLPGANGPEGVMDASR